MRQVERKAAERVLIVSHGLFIRCFVMRSFHLKVEEFDQVAGIRHPIPGCRAVNPASGGPASSLGTPKGCCQAARV